MVTAEMEHLARRVRLLDELPDPLIRRHLREQAGASLSQSAAAIGAQKEALRLWELGKRRPRGEMLDRYAGLLRMFATGGRL
jgi:DNA-binding transcriptional regulator YiaG